MICWKRHRKGLICRDATGGHHTDLVAALMEVLGKPADTNGSNGVSWRKKPRYNEDFHNAIYSLSQCFVKYLAQLDRRLKLPCHPQG